jgi:hypothetical protein
MKLTIDYTQRDGKNEYVQISVLQNCILDEYMLADTTFLSDGEISNKLRHVYWFPNIEVKENDTIILYTRSGRNRITKEAGQTTYHLFWKLGISVWNDDEKDVAILLEISDWGR